MRSKTVVALEEACPLPLHPGSVFVPRPPRTRPPPAPPKGGPWGTGVTGSLLCLGDLPNPLPTGGHPPPLELPLLPNGELAVEILTDFRSQQKTRYG